MSMEFIADIKGGVVVPPGHVSSFLRHCEGKQARIILGWGLKKRSLKQNSYYKGVVLPMFSQYLRESGCKVTNEQVDLLLKEWVCFVRDVEMPGGEIIGVPRSTTELDTKEMSNFTEQVIAEIAIRFQFYIPLPDEPLTATQG